MAFTLNAEARFHDGSPITVADVIWSFDTLKARGRPFFRSYYRSVVKAEAVGPRTVRFAFAGGMNRELPLIVSQLPVLSRAYWATRDFTRTTVEPPLGSGPYRVEAAEPGRSITYRRVPDYWAAALPVNVGRDNFDVLRYDYYRDGTVSLEAFKAGAYDFRQENSAKSWATGYDFPALKQGFVKKEQIQNEVPTGMQAFAYNTRRPFFADPRVRHALAYAFDFEWTNQHLFYGSYTRTKSYFSNSELAARGLPGPEELAILEPYRGRVPEAVFTKAYEPPSTDGSGHIRANIVDRAAHPRRGGLDRAGSEAGPRAERAADALRDSPQRADVGADQPALREEPGAPRRGGAAPGRGHAAVPVPHRQLRLRHGGQRVGRVPVARQRAAELLGVARRLRAGQRQPRGHSRSGRRRADRARDRGARSPGAHRPHAMPRPRAALGPLRHPAVAYPGLPRRLLEQVRAARGGAEVRARLRHLVGGSGARRRPARARPRRR